MALANVAARLCRGGLRTLMIDFDLEAPGLERYFPIDHEGVRANAGLLDLVSTYKQCMAQPIGRDAEAFKNLDRFIVPVYHKFPSGGHLDLLPAGQRGNEDQMSNYAYLLRTFDWQEFFFEWAGELFFRWLARELDNRYDLVLVDSRTGVTEMGGVCAYQLADSLVMFCAANTQNVQGTRDVIQNFNSDRVRALRKDRPLKVIVTPARVQHDSPEVEHFRGEFAPFEQYLPDALKERGLTFWDLMIPYNPSFAFEERVVDSNNGAEAEFGRAFERLAMAVTLTADPDSAVARFAAQLAPAVLKPVANNGGPARQIAEPEYDVTVPFAGYDVFISYNRADNEIAGRLASALQERGQKIFYDQMVVPGMSWEIALEQAIRDCRAVLIVIGAEMGRGQMDEISVVAARSTDVRVIPILAPGSSPDSVPMTLKTRQWLDMRAGVTEENVNALMNALGSAPVKKRSVESTETNPYPGLRSFEESDAPFFFGRQALVEHAIEHLESHRFLAIVGASGSGKSGLLRAGIIPALRARQERFQFLLSRPGSDPLRSLAQCLSPQGTGDAEKMRSALAAAGSIAEVFTPKTPTAIVVDQLEELWTAGNVSDRNQYLKLLASVERDAIAPITVIVILRADFYQGASQQPALADVLARNQIVVSPMTADELREAIELPARSTGVTFEPGLVDRILKDLATSATPLPLLQMLLTRLWRDRRRGFITHESYDRLGGVRILNQTAEDTYRRLPPNDQALAERVFLRLVTTNGFRIPVSLTVFSAEERKVIEAFVSASLMVVETRSNKDGKVELSHEAIITEWPRLQHWIRDNAERLRARDELKTAVEQWQSTGRNKDYLYRGSALRQAQRLLKESAGLLSPEAKEFVREAARASRRTLAAGIAGALTVLTFAGWVVARQYFQPHPFDLLRESPEVSLRVGGNRAFALQPDGTARLVNLSNNATLAKIPGVTAAVVSRDGRTGAAAMRNGPVKLFDASSGKAVGEIANPGKVTSLALAPDDQHLAAGQADGTIRLYNLRSGHQVLTAAAPHPEAIQSMTFYKALKQITAITAGGRFTVDLATGKVSGTTQ